VTPSVAAPGDKHPSDATGKVGDYDAWQLEALDVAPVLGLNCETLNGSAYQSFTLGDPDFLSGSTDILSISGHLYNMSIYQYFCHILTAHVQKLLFPSFQLRF